MDSKKNVLVFPSPTYPAIQIIDCLKSVLRFNVIAGAGFPNHAEFVCDDCILDIPLISDPGFIPYFANLIKERSIDLVIPTDDTAALFMMEHQDEIPATIVCSPLETTRLCKSKSLTYKHLAGEKFTPKTYSVDAIDQITEYPVFLKPDGGQASRGAKLIKSREDFDKLESLENCVICEYLPGEEYTVDCFTNKDRELKFCNPRVRTRLMYGITARGHDIPVTDEFREVMEELNRKIAFRGYWYAQLRRDKNGNLKLLEICTRFAGSFAFSKGKGVNLPLLACCDFSGIQSDVIVNDYTVECDKTYIDRMKISYEYDHLYIDFDDTVTTKSGTAINPYIIGYLYQCKYKKIKITLISRHQATFGETLKDALKRLSLSEDLFDEIIELEWDEKKYDYMRGATKSIFVDNSFKERKEIHDEIGIPVFDVCNVDCLFDWRH